MALDTTTTTVSGTTLQSLVKTFISLVDSLIPLLAGVALLLFLWGGVKFIYNSSETKGRIEGRAAMMWGVIALFVLFSLWSILSLLEASLLPTTSQTPTSAGSIGSNPAPAIPPAPSVPSPPSY